GPGETTGDDSATTDDPSDSGTDTGDTDTAGAEEGGCGCSADRDASGAGLLGLLALGLLRPRRRRASGS
ncbi:MAG: MYXO-CTERM sorting domain-containing protein, partial [Myxococcales bacterium]|nr:MYXO-CTERM sorting domain-containing protein [Myxococcales bacterium]